MPQTQKGSWFLHYREKMDANLIEGIKGLLYEIWHTREGSEGQVPLTHNK